MRTVALTTNALAVLAAFYDAKLLVWDIAVDDARRGGGWLEVVISLVVSAAFVALPLVVGMRWAMAARPGAALAVALLSFGLSVAGFVILAAAFTP